MGFSVGVADKVIPVLAPLLDKFTVLDLAKYGQALGEGVAFIVQTLADGKLETILYAPAKIAFAGAVNFLAGTVTAVAMATSTRESSFRIYVRIEQLAGRDQRAPVAGNGPKHDRVHSHLSVAVNNSAADLTES